MERWSQDGRILQTFSGPPTFTVDTIELHSGIIVTSNNVYSMKMWKVSSGECFRTMSLPNNVFGLVKLSRDKFVSWEWNSALRVWNDVGDCIETIPTERGMKLLRRVGNDIVMVSLMDNRDGLIYVRRLK